MSPLSKEVMLRQPMASVLTALRSNKQGLLNLMDIFINEPLVEWRERALNIRPLGSNSVEQGGGGGAEGDLKVDQGVGSGGNEGGAISIMGAASSSTSSSSSSSSSASLHQVPEWYPIKKLEIARRKLDGENPCHLLVEELEMGHGSRDWFQAAKAAVMGSGGGGVGASTITPTLRSTAPRICQDVQQQVDCLLDLATDQDLLGRTYVGWKPWC